MFKKFIHQNSRSITIISVLVGLWVFVYFLQQPSTKSLIQHPQKNDIYIFSNKKVYTPMRIDSIAAHEIYMRNYLYLFKDAIPQKKQILPHEFDLNFYAIYTRKELLRLDSIGTIVKVYR